MSREGARKLLDIWDFFEKNQKTRRYEGIERHDFFELMQSITGEEDLGAARGYLEKVAAGEVNETVPAKIVEDAKEDRIPEKKVESTKRAISEVEDWIKKLKAKTPEEVAERDVAAAKVIAVIKTTEEVPTEPAAPPVAGPAPAPSGAPTTAAPAGGATAGFSIVIGKPPKVAAPVSLEKGIRNSVAAATLAPLQLAGSMASQVLARENPGLLTNVELTRRGVTAGKIAPLKTQALAAGMSSTQFDNLLKSLATLPTGRFSRAISGFKSYGELSEFIYKGELSISSGYVPGAIFLTPSAGGELTVYTPSIVGGLATQAAQRIFGGLASRAIKALIGTGTKAAVGVAAEAGVAAVGAGTGAGLGALFGGIGAIPGAVVGWLAGKIPDLISWFKTHAKDFGVAAFALIVGGVFLNNIFLVGLGGGVGAISLAAGGTGAIGQGATGFLQTLYVGLTTLVLPSLAVPLIITFVTIPVLVAFIYYVITAGAFVAPKQIGAGPSFNLPFSLTGPLPSGIPFGWPVRSPIIQGPNTTYTHAGAQAIDIIDPIGTPVKATSPGVAAVYDFGPFGKHVEIQGTTENLSFTVRYAHLSVILVGNGQTVEAEQTIGLVGNTGNSDTPHLHYEFKGLPMAPPFIPKAVPEGCLGIESCNVTTD